MLLVKMLPDVENQESSMTVTFQLSISIVLLMVPVIT